MSMDIYDRRFWPSPAANPLVNLFERDSDWYSNKEIVAALGLSATRPKALISQWPTLIDQIGEDNTALAERGLMLPTSERGRRAGGLERYYTKKALVLIAMRAQTTTAAAFRDCLAEDHELEARFDRIGK